jgi:solute:Na+ symporter, SSS family
MAGLDPLTIPFFLIFFIAFVGLGFYGSRWRRGDLSHLHEWALAGRRLGTWLAFFLVGADLYTAYTFVAVPSGVYAKGALYFFAVPYVAITFAIAIFFMPKLWAVAKEKGYVTGSDFVRDKFSSRTLSILIAITGIVALLPYIALQIVGMQAVLAAILVAGGYGASASVEEIALVVAFIILAAFTFTSGLRGAALTAVFKDVIIWVSVIAVVVAVLSQIGGNFSAAFSGAPATFATLPNSLVPGYFTLVLGSGLALYLYPHAVTGVLSAESVKKLRMSTSLLPFYGLGLAFLALFGVLIYAEPASKAFLANFPASSQGIYVVPSLMLNTLPGWLAGICLLGVFIGGLVPAAIMAIAQANLLTRNIIKEYRPNMAHNTETRIAKWASAVFKFIALGFVFAVPATYAIQLQLLGGILIIQLLPAMFLGLFTSWFRRQGLIVGLLAGLASGVYLALAANKYSSLTTSLYSTPFGNLYIAVISVIINLVLAAVISAAVPGRSKPMMASPTAP